MSDQDDAPQPIDTLLIVDDESIDTDGYLVMANRASEQLLGGAPALLGELAGEVLPANLLDGELDEAGKGRSRLADGRQVEFWRYPLGGAATTIGTALVVQHVSANELS